MEEARRSIGTELQTFARNTLQYIDSEALITFEPLVLPPLLVKIRGRHALVVVRGHDYQHDLKALRPYVREYKPVLIAWSTAGPMRSFTAQLAARRDHRRLRLPLTDAAMHCGAQLIHHVHPDGRAPGRENLVAAGVEYDEFVAEGMSEDAALLIAYEAESDPHRRRRDPRDDGGVPRQGSTRHGVDLPHAFASRPGARGCKRCGVKLYEGRIRRLDMLFLVASAVLAMVAMIYASHSLHVFFDGFRLMFSDAWGRVTHWF